MKGALLCKGELFRARTSKESDEGKSITTAFVCTRSVLLSCRNSFIGGSRLSGLTGPRDLCSTDFLKFVGGSEEFPLLSVA